MIMPAGILVAGTCLRLSFAQIPAVLRSAIWLVGLAAAGLLGIGLVRQDHMIVIGAAAAMFATLSIILAHRMPQPFLPTILVLLLIGNWGWFKSQEYLELVDRNEIVRKEAMAVPWEPGEAILTDPLTAQILPYLHRFDPLPQVATWKGEKEGERPFYWTRRVDTPWAGKYWLVWHPIEAGNQAARWGTEVPSWVLKEVARGRLIKEFGGEPGGGVFAVGRERGG